MQLWASHLTYLSAEQGAVGGRVQPPRPLLRERKQESKECHGRKATKERNKTAPIYTLPMQATVSELRSRI